MTFRTIAQTELRAWSLRRVGRFCRKTRATGRVQCRAGPAWVTRAARPCRGNVISTRRRFSRLRSFPGPRAVFPGPRSRRGETLRDGRRRAAFPVIFFAPRSSYPFSGNGACVNPHYTAGIRAQQCRRGYSQTDSLISDPLIVGRLIIKPQLDLFARKFTDMNIFDKFNERNSLYTGINENGLVDVDSKRNDVFDVPQQTDNVYVHLSSKPISQMLENWNQEDRTMVYQHNSMKSDLRSSDCCGRSTRYFTDHYYPHSPTNFRSLATRNLYCDYYDPHKKDPESKYYGQDANGNATKYTTQGKDIESILIIKIPVTKTISHRYALL
ncbi:Hypothetical protein CINCED_3A000012 [Cinara cedri]|uniref:Uncharacterized protein n=1 Tax=Cinara cedri TaxID=506608 RepID=A0A5E4LZW8_9HEMI|nr:Hypothetical protein CINCED_3A000012 [Cinara cedri]